MNNSFISNFSLTFLTNAAIILFGLLNNVLIVRTTGAKGLGLFTLATISANTIMTLLGGGAILETNRYLAKKHKGEVIPLFFNSLFFSLVMSVFIFLWWTLLGGYPLEYFLNMNIVILVMLAIPFILIQEANKGILWGIEKIGKHNLINLFRSGFPLVSNIILLVLLHKNIELAISGWLITLLLGAVISVWYVVGAWGHFKLIISKNVFLKFLNTGWRTFLISTLAIIALRADIYIIKFFLDNIAVGYYSIVVLILSTVNITPMVGGLLIFNRAVIQTNKGIMETAQLNRICVAYSILISLFLILFGKWAISFLFGFEFIKSYYCLLYALPALIAQNLISVIAMFICGNEGFPAFNILSIIIALILNIILSLILIPKIGINGAAVSASIAIGTRAVMHTFYFKLRTKLRLSEFMVLKSSDFIDLKNKLGLRLA